MKIFGGKSCGKFAKIRENGSVNPLMIGLIFAIVVALGAGGFAFWSYSQMTQYKNTADEKAVAAAQKATEDTTKKVTDQLNKEFDEKYKQPFSNFLSPSKFGTVSFQYPKTWAQFVQSNTNSFAAYFYPLAVPPIDNATAYALRVNVVPQTYAQILQSFQGKIKNGDLTSTTLNTGINGGAKGVMIKGQFSEKINGSLAAFPVLNGNYTLEIYNDNKDFNTDFMNTVLPSLKYDL